MSAQLGHITSVDDIVTILRDGPRPTTEAQLDTALVAMIQIRVDSHTPARLGTWVTRAMLARARYVADYLDVATAQAEPNGIDSNAQPTRFARAEGPSTGDPR